MRSIISTCRSDNRRPRFPRWLISTCGSGAHGFSFCDHGCRSLGRIGLSRFGECGRGLWLRIVSRFRCWIFPAALSPHPTVLTTRVISLVLSPLLILSLLSVFSSRTKALCPFGSRTASSPWRTVSMIWIKSWARRSGTTTHLDFCTPPGPSLQFSSSVVITILRRSTSITEARSWRLRTLTLLGLGLAGMGARRWRQRKRS